MNTPDEIAPNPEVQTTPKRKARKAARTSKPRTIDPEILKLREEHKQRVSDLRASRDSQRMLRVIIDKRLPKLTQNHRDELFRELSGCCTLPLPLDKPEGQ